MNILCRLDQIVTCHFSLAEERGTEADSIWGMQEFIKEMDLKEDTSHYHVEKILSLSEAMPDHRRPIRNSTTVPAKGIKEVTQFEELNFQFKSN